MRRSASEPRRALLFAALVSLVATQAWGDDVYLTPEEAPSAVFRNADRFERSLVVSTPELQAEVRAKLGAVKPTVWEARYPVTVAYRGDECLGRAIIVEEVGKHRAITFVVGVDPQGQVSDVAVMTYREAYGGEVRSRRFLAQYQGKTVEDSLAPGTDVRNLAGATLSAKAIGRGVKKAIAVLAALDAPPLHARHP